MYLCASLCFYIPNFSHVKRLLFFLYILITLCLAAATIIEKYQGSEFVSAYVYGSTWFCVLWGIGTAVAIAYFLKQRVRRLSTVCLHLAFVVILLGALLTHLSSYQGIIHLRVNESTKQYLYQDKKVGMKLKDLPFEIRLDTFYVDYHEGTNSASDYISKFTIVNGEDEEKGEVSMNQIYSHHNIRLYQSSYDEDAQGSYLSINSDPYGIPVTYAGYALLFVSLIWMLIGPKGSYRQLLRHPLIKKGVLSLVLMLSVQGVFALNSLPKETAEEFGKLHILYNGRICPLQTYAIDFTKKLYGKRHYGEYSAEQVLTGFIFWFDEWSREPIIKVKSGDVRQATTLPKFTTYHYLDNSPAGYKLAQLQYREANDKLYQDAMKVIEKIFLVSELKQGKYMSVFPYDDKGNITWYGPVDALPEDMDEGQKQFIQGVFSVLYEQALSGNFEEMNETIGKMQKYQQKYGAASLPSATRFKAERIYNKVPFATILFMVNLTLGFLCLFISIYQLTRSKVKGRKSMALWNVFALVVLGISFLALSFALALRWIVSGTVPMSNGYETMLFMAWSVMLLTFIAYRRFHIILTFGFLMSGFFLLVSHISQMDPQISHLMPVLASPLLSIHVSVIMMSYALLSLTFICGLMALLLRVVRGKHAERLKEQLQLLQLLSQLFLYPAITTMGLGIFIGAIWANVSWGTYWSWDPKETWALITLMVYAVALHRKTIPALAKPINYHVFMVFAFLTILMTYFGVNYFLGGMHSYA